MKTYLHVAGGTAGHVFPAQAIAEQNNQAHHILLTDHRGLKFAQFFQNKHLSPINRKKLFTTLFHTIKHTYQIFSKNHFHGVFVYGGYVTLIPSIIAKLKGIPLYTIENNKNPGKANQLISKIATKNFSTFAPYSKTVIQLGFFTRKAFQQTVINKQAATKEAKIRILILGSSVGTAFFCIKLPQALKLLTNTSQIHIIHNAPHSFHEKLTKFYKESNISHELHDFITDIPEKMHTSTLIISRAGGSTLAESYTLKKYSLLIPIKHSAGNHQLHNAKAMEQLQIASYIEEDNCKPEILVTSLKNALKQAKNTTSHKQKIPITASKNIWKHIIE